MISQELKHLIQMIIVVMVVVVLTEKINRFPFIVKRWERCWRSSHVIMIGRLWVSSGFSSGDKDWLNEWKGS